MVAMQPGGVGWEGARGHSMSWVGETGWEREPTWKGMVFFFRKSLKFLFFCPILKKSFFDLTRLGPIYAA